MFFTSAALLALSATAKAHCAGWKDGMYCRGGNVTGVDNPNTNTAVQPLYQLPKEKWWFQADRGCDLVPPEPGLFLELPAGGSFTVEIAHNRGQTTLSFDGKDVSDWPDGKQHPEDWHGPGSPPDCIQDDGAMHTNNQSMTGGTAFAISYNSNLQDVTIENLAVFSVLAGSPWHRMATYQVPADLPPCPADGCHCAWLWVPKGCGIPNMYMQGFKCKVTNSTSTKTVSPAKPPVYCGDGKSQCVTGAKQMIAWNQASGNNVQTPPNGDWVNYGDSWGYHDGAQNDIFA